MSIVVNDTNSNIYKVCVNGEKRTVTKIITSENGVKKTIYNNKYNNLLVAYNREILVCNMDNKIPVTLDIGWDSFINITYIHNYYLGITSEGYIYKSVDGILWEKSCRIYNNVGISVKSVKSATFFVYKEKIFLLVNIKDISSIISYYNNLYVLEKDIFNLIWENKYYDYSFWPSMSTDGEYIFMYATGGSTVTNDGKVYGNRIEVKMNIDTYEITETKTHPRAGIGGGSSYDNIRCEIDMYKNNTNDDYYGDNSQKLIVLKYKNKNTTPSRHQLYNCPSIPLLGNSYYSNSLTIKHVNRLFFIFGSYSYNNSYYPIVYSSNGDNWTVDANFQYDQYNVLDIFYYRNSYCVMSQNKESSKIVFFETNDFITFEQMDINIGNVDSNDLPKLICAAYNDDKIR